MLKLCWGHSALSLRFLSLAPAEPSLGYSAIGSTGCTYEASICLSVRLRLEVVDFLGFADLAERFEATDLWDRLDFYDLTSSS